MDWTTWCENCKQQEGRSSDGNWPSLDNEEAKKRQGAGTCPETDALEVQKATKIIIGQVKKQGR